MTDWFYIGAIFAQSAMLFWCGSMLFRSGKVIKELAAQLKEAGRLLDEASALISRQRDEIKMLRVIQGGSAKVVTSLNELPPEARAGVRERLAYLLGELKKNDN
jgi:hypothetical protein